MTTKKVTKDTAMVPMTGNDMVQLAIDKGIDGDALMKLMDAAERQTKEVARQAFFAAKAKFQSLCPVITKDGSIMGGKRGEAKYKKAGFASYPQIKHIITPILAQCDLSLTYRDTVNADGSVTTTCLVSHIGGHVDDSGSFTGPARAELYQMSGYQEHGAAQAYRKRYACIAALDLVTDEDTERFETVEAITESQAADLTALIEQSGIPLARLLKWAGVESIGQMPATHYAEACKRVQDYMSSHPA